jgi:hypothetical protein
MIEELLPRLDNISPEERRRHYFYYHQLTIDALQVDYHDSLLADEISIALHLDIRLTSLSLAIVKKVLSSLSIKGVLTLAPNFSLYLERIVVPDLALGERFRRKLKRSLGTTKVMALRMVAALSLLFNERLKGNYDPERIFEEAYEKIDELTVDPMFEMMTLCYHAATSQ